MTLDPGSASAWLGMRFSEVVLAVSVLHQGLVELYKLLFAYKMRQYWQALAYIVYGPTLNPASVTWKPGPMDRLSNTVARQPRTLAPEVRRAWDGGPQDRLIQSFLLRAVGDSPVTEISDADVRNVVEIVRDAADREKAGAGRVSRTLEELLRLGERRRDRIAAALQGVEGASSDVTAWLQGRIASLAGQDEIGAAQLTVLQQEFDREFVPGIVRARREMGNALKAAEFKYHRNLHAVSAVLAAIEGVVVACLMGIKDRPQFVIAVVIAFGLLLVVPRGTKSLTDAIIAIGGKLKR
jgi:hypothetical protein